MPGVTPVGDRTARLDNSAPIDFRARRAAEATATNRGATRAHRLVSSLPVSCVGTSERPDVFCLRALLTLRDVELDGLTLVERTVAAALDRREVNETSALPSLGAMNP